MEGIVDLKTVNDYCARFYTSALHPLVTTLNLGVLTRKSQETVGLGLQVIHRRTVNHGCWSNDFIAC